jgi:hypothetical protein
LWQKREIVSEKCRTDPFYNLKHGSAKDFCEEGLEWKNMAEKKT